jgi:tubby-related protein 1
MSARKRKKSKSSNYVISLDKIPDSKAKIKALGKVRSNFLGTQFTVYSEGRNPFKQSAKDQLSKPVRSELVTVIYETNLFGLDGPRKMTAILPAIRDKDERAEIKPTRVSCHFIKKYPSYINLVSGKGHYHGKVQVRSVYGFDFD